MNQIQLKGHCRQTYYVYCQVKNGHIQLHCVWKTALCVFNNSVRQQMIVIISGMPGPGWLVSQCQCRSCLFMPETSSHTYAHTRTHTHNKHGWYGPTWLISQSPAPCGLQGCKNGPAPFPGRMLYKATKPGLVSVLYLSMFFYYVGVY